MKWARRLKEATGFVVGSVTGGVSQEKAAAGVVVARDKVLSVLEGAGERIGATGAGSNVFEALAKGARTTDRQESQRFFNEKIGFSPDSVKAFFIVVLALAGIWTMLRAVKG